MNQVETIEDVRRELARAERRYDDLKNNIVLWSICVGSTLFVIFWTSIQPPY